MEGLLTAWQTFLAGANIVLVAGREGLAACFADLALLLLGLLPETTTILPAVLSLIPFAAVLSPAALSAMLKPGPLAVLGFVAFLAAAWDL